ncbi:MULTISPECIES: hypothetical protein [Deinococcus]|nr:MULTISPECIES: hypothetical protein [Deinococcus]MBI0445715.1 hypothetical protein [Deinococcus sp. DB0503]TDE86355.1 hypothetical protein E0686_06670 [Deinococcus sp. S9]
MKSRRSHQTSSGKLNKWLVYAPIALEIISLVRRNQQAKRSKYTRLRKRDRALDFLLGQAERRLSGKKTRRRWF